MERLVVVGLSWRQEGPEGLARYTIGPDAIATALPAMRDRIGARGMVYISTCNRVEWVLDVGEAADAAEWRRRVFSAVEDHEPAPGEAERRFRAWVGEGAVEHLFLVSTGLDSLRIGETDVHGQVRIALDRAREHRLTTPRLELVLEEALRVARRVRGNTELGRGHVSLAEVAHQRAHQRLVETPGSVALVGVSAMTERCARSLVEAGSRIVVVNRTEARAEVLAREVGGTARSLEGFQADPDPVEVVITATGSAQPILQEATLLELARRAPSGRAPLVIDLAIPADVDPEDAKRIGIERVGIEEIFADAEQNRAARLLEAADARVQLDEALASFRVRLAEWSLAPTLARLQEHYRDVAKEATERLLRRELKHLAEGDQAAVHRWSEALARKLAHLPATGLRTLSQSHGLPAVSAFLSSSPDLRESVYARGSEAAQVQSGDAETPRVVGVDSPRNFTSEDTRADHAKPDSIHVNGTVHNGVDLSAANRPRTGLEGGLR